MSSEATSKELILEGEVMRLAIDAATGAFTSIRNKAAHLELLSRLPRKRHVPWIVGFIAAAGGKSDEHQMDNCRDFERLDVEPLAEPKGFILLWKTTQGPTVQMRVLLREADSGLPERLEFWASADNPTMRILQTLNAPYINGIGPPGSDEETGLNRLAHSAHSGFLVDDPVGLMERPFAPGEERFRFWPMRYPNGFHAPMQFFAYYVDGRGGFYFAAHDPHHTAKRIDFQREPNGDIVISTPNYQWNERPGEPMQLEYPYVIAPLVRGSRAISQMGHGVGTRQSNLGTPGEGGGPRQAGRLGCVAERRRRRLHVRPAGQLRCLAMAARHRRCRGRACFPRLRP